MRFCPVTKALINLALDDDPYWLYSEIEQGGFIPKYVESSTQIEVYSTPYGADSYFHKLYNGDLRPSEGANPQKKSLGFGQDKAI